MSNYQFRISSAAQLYVKHLEVIREIRDSKSKDAKHLYAKHLKIVEEMRAETYRNIAEFGNVLLKLLCGKEGLAHKETTPVGSYAGGKIHYLWIEAASDKEKKRKVREVGMVSFALPIPNKVKNSNDATWETYWGVFDIVRTHRFKVWVNYEGSDLQARQQILELARNKQFGTFHEDESESNYSICSMWIPLKSDNLVGSAAETLKSLVRKVYEAQKRL